MISLIKKFLKEDRFQIDIKNDNGEVDVILGHNDHILNKYKRNNVKLKGGWYYRNIATNTEFLLYIIEKYNISKMNFIGTSKSCTGSVILTKELLKKGSTVKFNLFMFSAYTTVDKNVYIKRNLVDKVPGTLTSFWESDRYTPAAIKRMDARGLMGKKNVHMYFFFPGRSKYGEKVLAHRVTGDNVTYIELPVYMHNTLYPFWKQVENNKTIELYENQFREMHDDDFAFYSRMQNYDKYHFHLYSVLEDPKIFVKNLGEFLDPHNTQNIRIGPHVRLDKSVQLEAPVRLWGTSIINKDCSIGAFSFINSETTIFPQTHIGRYCSIGKKCEIAPGDHPLDWLSTSVFQYGMHSHFPDHNEDCIQITRQSEDNSQTTIGNDVWIGSLSLIKRGVTIGNGAVIAAGSVVTKDVPPYAIVGGVPAKVIKYRFDEEIIAKLLTLEWWTLLPEQMKDVMFDNIHTAISQIEEIKKIL